MLIIPGQEIDIRWHQEVELFLPNGATFRFLAHPGYPTVPNVIENIQGIEIENALHFIDKGRAIALAEEHDLILLSNSDAHTIDTIGRCYTEIDIEELIARAR